MHRTSREVASRKRGASPRCCDASSRRPRRISLRQRTMSPSLIRLGWNTRLEQACAEYATAGAIPGRVALEHTHIYRVLTETGETLARVSGRLRHHAAGRADFPAVGDWVALEPSKGGGDARIVAVLPRS